MEVAHNWRQTTVTMAARNFLDVDANIFYPRIDFAGDKSGITGMEFPILNYLIFIFAKIFGYQHWYGRLINLIVSSFGIFYFYKLVKDFFTEKIAFNSSIVLLFSLWFSYSRKIMPDTFATSIAIFSLYFGFRYFYKSQNIRNVLLYFMFGTIAILSKLPVAYIFILFFIPIFDKRLDVKHKIIFSSISIIVLAPSIYWYFVWVPYLVKEFGFWHFFMGKPISEAVVEIANNINMTLKRFYETPLKYSGFALFLFGIFNMFKQKNTVLKYILGLSFLAFLVIILKSGRTFYFHTYYILPFIPIMALMAGYGISKIKSPKIALYILIFIGIEGVANQHQDFKIKEKEYKIVELENVLDKFSGKSDKILINSDENPTAMYFAHRKGWIASNDKIKDAKYISELKSKGCKYIVILKKVFGTEAQLPYIKIFDSKDYSIYKIK